MRGAWSWNTGSDLPQAGDLIEADWDETIPYYQIRWVSGKWMLEVRHGAPMDWLLLGKETLFELVRSIQ